MVHTKFQSLMIIMAATANAAYVRLPSLGIKDQGFAEVERKGLTGFTEFSNFTTSNTVVPEYRPLSFVTSSATELDIGTVQTDESVSTEPHSNQDYTSFTSQDFVDALNSFVDTHYPELRKLSDPEKVSRVGKLENPLHVSVVSASSGPDKVKPHDTTDTSSATDLLTDAISEPEWVIQNSSYPSYAISLENNISNNSQSVQSSNDLLPFKLPEPKEEEGKDFYDDMDRNHNHDLSIHDSEDHLQLLRIPNLKYTNGSDTTTGARDVDEIDDDAKRGISFGIGGLDHMLEAKINAHESPLGPRHDEEIEKAKEHTKGQKNIPDKYMPT